ncbi:MAG: methyltransferase [Candidatus Paceibacterota bacterium]
MILSPAQQKQVDIQVDAHKHTDYKTDIVISDDLILKNFQVRTKVLRPEIMSSLQLAQWLHTNNNIYKSKKVLDMGTGSGIQGIVTGLSGAEKVVCADISDDAVQNASLNIINYELTEKITAIESDLFTSIGDQTFDLIIFNHMFFSDGPMEEQITKDFSEIERGSLIHRFFDEARRHLTPNGLIIMPYLELAGPVNSPKIQAPRHGYSVETVFNENVTVGIQQGEVSIYKIKSLSL